MESLHFRIRWLVLITNSILAFGSHWIGCTTHVVLVLSHKNAKGEKDMKVLLSLWVEYII